MKESEDLWSRHSSAPSVTWHLIQAIKPESKQIEIPFT